MQTSIPRARVPTLHRVPFSIRNTVNAKNVKGTTLQLFPLSRFKADRKVLKMITLL